MMQRQHRERPADQDAGFTILEMLVSLALMALVATFLAGGVQFGRRVWDLTGRIDQLATISAVREALHQRISSALPVLELEANGSLPVAFKGGPSELSFVAALPDRQLPAGLYKVRLALQGRDLALDFAGFQQRFAGGVLPGTLSQSRLLTKVSRLQLRYFGPAEPGDPKSWRTDWHREDALPDLVGVTLTFPEADLRQWPELIISLHSTKP